MPSGRQASNITRLVPAYFAYFRPGFHPDDRDTTALIEQWRTELFGEQGTLNDKLASRGGATSPAA